MDEIKTKRMIVAVLFGLLLLGFILTLMSSHRDIKYLDQSCPICGSNEVLDMGWSHECHEGYCSDCGVKMAFRDI